MTLNVTVKREMELTVKQLSDLAQLGDRDAFRQLLDIRAMGNEEAMTAVAEINRLDAERMERIFA